ncbi:MAG: hypothetical protein OIF57_14930 [Marinobacterium sp.]|nr:hypothetical protein [Marinobacterium sp.]
MEKHAQLVFTKLQCLATTGETGKDEVMFYLDVDDQPRIFSPSKTGRYKFSAGGGTESISNVNIDVSTVDKIYIKMIECDKEDYTANKNDTIGYYTFYRKDLLEVYDWENMDAGESPSEEFYITFDEDSPGSENKKGTFRLYYRIITNPIPTVRVLGIRCEQQSAGCKQAVVDAMLTVAEEATDKAGDVIGKSPRPRAKVIGDAFKAASKVLQGVAIVSDWIGRIIEGKNDEVYMDRVYPSRGLNGAFFPPTDGADFYKIQSGEDVYFEEQYGRYFRFPLDNGPVTLELREYDPGKADINIGAITVDPAKIAANSSSGIDSDTMTKGVAVMDGGAVVELADSYGKRDGEGALYHICYSVGYEDWSKDATTEAQENID